MSVQVVGAGLGRTGTTSLKLVLEQLLDGRCYHMIEVFGRPADAVVWQRAAEGGSADWAELLRDYDAAVDWPAAAFWRELSDAFPDAPVLLSTREPDAWWTSASNTIFAAMDFGGTPDPAIAAQRSMIESVFTNRFTPDWLDADAAKAAYMRHNDEVRATVPADRLIDYHPGDGWAPLCVALDVPVPDVPFPHTNTTDEFRAMTGLDKPAG